MNFGSFTLRYEQIGCYFINATRISLWYPLPRKFSYQQYYFRALNRMELCIKSCANGKIKKESTLSNSLITNCRGGRITFGDPYCVTKKKKPEIRFAHLRSLIFQCSRKQAFIALKKQSPALS
jgi:hypothetical protein